MSSYLFTYVCYDCGQWVPYGTKHMCCDHHCKDCEWKQSCQNNKPACYIPVTIDSEGGYE